MRLLFFLAWLPNAQPKRKMFSNPSTQALFENYLERMAPPMNVEMRGALPIGPKASSTKRWVCERAKGAKALSSEEIADQLTRVQNVGTKTLEIIIGGPDGFSSSELELLKPDLRWSFGPLTLPHELAAVIAAEQLYRAQSILRGMPYHLKH